MRLDHNEVCMSVHQIWVIDAPRSKVNRFIRENHYSVLANGLYEDKKNVLSGVIF